MAENNIEDQGIKRIYIVGAIALVVLFWIGNWWLGFWYLEADERGTFGDTFGAVNALFSGLALAGLCYAILLQQHELRITKKDARRTKQMLDEQTQHLELQNANHSKQAFEVTFFQMLKLLSDLTEQLSIASNHPNSSSTKIIGKMSFRVFKSKLWDLKRRKESNIKSKCLSKHGIDDSVMMLLMGEAEREKNKALKESALLEAEEFIEEIDFITEIYDEFFMEMADSLNHYFLTLYSIIEFIDRSCPSDQRFYTNIVRAQLSKSELEILLYNCASINGREKFKPLVERYGFLKHLVHDDLVEPKIIKLYNQSAFA
ncbi:putative phage abortive infection protein [Flexibacterium corallicola]|uniref:putative phage abortive infection protein n=1 Tax=Flexibacterium corallicola TaxID=3037259 RepID=UPI00286EE50B|nr:putative phage abortive infection protein [Pseudovibrio sp. M1P-2-3]